jgi:GTP pyrophosphokinase
MNKLAESGVASHWLYKTSETQINELHQKTHQWLQSLLESLAQSGDSVEFLEHLKVDLFPDEVYVFSPKGKIFAMPRGATTVDFAYAVHTDIGNRCVATKVNSELVPLRTELRNGDRVEIVTAPHAHPNPAWLGYVVTSKARSEIRHALKTMHLDESSKLGERLLGQALSSLSIKLQDIPDICWDRVLKETGSKSRQELLTDIGLGRRLNMVIAKQLAKMSDGENSRSESNSGGVITLLGNEGMAIQYAKCCRPIPGDPIIGVIKSGQGLVVHTHDCPTLRKGRSGDEWLDVVWDKNITRPFDVSLKLIVANRRGVLAKVAAAIAEAESNIENVSFSNEGEYTATYFTLQVSNRLHLATIMRNLRKIQEVIRIIRVKNTG